MPASEHDEPLWDPDDEELHDHLAQDREEGSGLTGARKGRQGYLRKIWRPRPIRRPEVDSDLPKMPWPERCAEALRYATHKVEHWLSSRGVLREWIRLNLWIGVGLLALALLVVPPVTILLEGVADWSGLLKTTALNVTAIVMGLPPIVIAAASLFIVIKLLSRSWRRRRRQHDCRDDPYS